VNLAACSGRHAERACYFPGRHSSFPKPQRERKPEVDPERLRYAKTHEWVLVQTDPSGAKIATVGLSAFAIEALADLVHVELPEVGRQVEAGKPFGQIESVKAVSDLYSPVDGEIVEANTELEDKLEHMADDPYEGGWFVKIKITDEAGLDDLLDYAAYQQQCEEEGEG
jgi:glycine cleavage system H protein